METLGTGFCHSGQGLEIQVAGISNYCSVVGMNDVSFLKSNSLACFSPPSAVASGL